MRTLISFAITAVALIGVALADKRIRSQRDMSTAIDQGVDLVRLLPQTIGTWESREFPLDSVVVKVAGCKEYKALQFVDGATGRSVQLVVMVGPPGPMSEHVPEVCYPAGGYTLVRNSLRERGLNELTGPDYQGRLASMDFMHPRFDRPVRVWHGWYDGSNWSRPRYPRLTFYSRKVLYRMHLSSFLITETDRKNRIREIDAAEDFLRVALPVITDCLNGKLPAEPSEESRPTKPASTAQR